MRRELLLRLAMHSLVAMYRHVVLGTCVNSHTADRFLRPGWVGRVTEQQAVTDSR